MFDIGWNLENSYRNLPEFFYSNTEPTAVQAPSFVVWNQALAKELGIEIKPKEETVDYFAGNKLPVGSQPIAQAYAGHQFAHFTMLGDGRAVLLGEQITADNKRYDIQLKGSGRTDYSRGGDGRAALGPMLREYIISEAMHGLRIPTSRSLAVVTTGEPVYREITFDGAILTRVASSHLRVGTFQYARQWGTKADLEALVDYAIERHYPHVKESKNKYVAFLQEVVDKQAFLTAQWQLVGFIHGVLNTDNVTISGETIDYGPCAFMDTYDKATVFSSIDRRGRYAYGNQPDIGGWNVARLAEALLVMIDDDEEKALEIAKEVVSDYPNRYETYWLDGMRKKLGLLDEQEEDQTIIYRLLDLMEQYQADFTNTFRSLTLQRRDESIKMFTSNAFKEWQENWQRRVRKQGKSDQEIQRVMKENNPSIIPRNYLVEEAIEAAVSRNDYTVMERLMAALENPYAYTKDQEEFAGEPPASEEVYQTFCGT